MKPDDDNNFLIEVTPEIVDDLYRIYMHSDTEPVTRIHYSPYWKKSAPNPTKVKQEG